MGSEQAAGGSPAQAKPATRNQTVALTPLVCLKLLMICVPAVDSAVVRFVGAVVPVPYVMSVVAIVHPVEPLLRDRYRRTFEDEFVRAVTVSPVGTFHAPLVAPPKFVAVKPLPGEISKLALPVVVTCVSTSSRKTSALNVIHWREPQAVCASAVRLSKSVRRRAALRATRIGRSGMPNHVMLDARLVSPFAAAAAATGTVANAPGIALANVRARRAVTRGVIAGRRESAGQPEPPWSTGRSARSRAGECDAR